MDTASPVGYNIASEVQQLISSLMVLGAFVGSLGAGPTAVKMGRKQCLWIACLLCSAGNGIMLGTTTLAGLYTGRILIGLANGFFITFSQLYIQVSQRECRTLRSLATINRALKGSESTKEKAAFDYLLGMRPCQISRS